MRPSALATIDSARVGRAIRRALLAEQGVATSVACPARPPRRAGYRFVCEAMLAVGSYAIDVTETDARGGVRFSGRAPLRVLDAHAIERGIERAMRSPHRRVAAIVCPAPVLAQAGLSFTCRGRTSGGRRSSFVVTEVDANGSVRFAAS